MTSGPTPQSLAQSGSEHAHQVALFAWAALNFNRHPELRQMFAIPNGGERNKITAANLKAEGVKAGVCDIFLPAPRHPWHGLFIELKVGKNRPSPSQTAFIADMQKLGYGACWCLGWERAAEIIEQYLSS